MASMQDTMCYLLMKATKTKRLGYKARSSGNPTNSINMSQHHHILIQQHYTFLDALSHLYKRVCPSVRQSVCPSVRLLLRRSIHPSVRRSVGHTRVETMQKCRFRPKLLSVRARTHLMPCIRPCYFTVQLDGCCVRFDDL